MIVDLKKISQVEKIYKEIKILYDAQIVNSEISGRYNRLQNNLSTIVEKKIDEIDAITERISDGITI